MARSRKAQQAVEYLITYGWAFVVILLTLGAFSYFGLLSPMRYLPERCDFGVQMLCEDFVLSEYGDNGVVMVKFRNSFGHDIAIYDFRTADNSGEFKVVINGELTSPKLPIKVADGEVTPALAVDLSGSDYALVEGEKVSVPLMINFTRCDPQQSGSCVPPAGGPYHALYGEVFARVQKSK